MKKVLSWVLVLALVLGSFSMAFAGDTDNASNMKDAAQIKNVEAVDVMVATGIIGGYPDGNYYPEKTVTRAEMAKMICIAVNGGEDVGSYYASSCDFADSKDHWAAGYIAYCANEGIIDGRSADVFDPDATVTGSEAAKMMLVALGYSAKAEKYVGGQWEANVLKAAKANDLFDGCDSFVAGAALNRDNAAQIIFNGLNAYMVEYDSDYEITTGDTTVTVNSKVNYVLDAADKKVELFKDAFDGDLEKSAVTDGKDDFGRPAHEWKYDDEEIGTYANEADYSFVVTDDTSLQEAMEAYDEDLADEFYVDNEKALTEKAKYNGTEVNTTALSAVGTYKIALGDTIELYNLKDTNVAKDVYRVVVCHYEAVQIAVDTDVKDSDAKKDITAYIEVGNVDTNNVDLPGYDAVAYTDEAVIAVAYKGGDNTTTNVKNVLDTYVPEKVTGEVTKRSSAAGKIVVDGTSYEYINGDDVDGVAIGVEKTYDLYLINGYVAGAVLVDDNSTELYGILLGFKTNTGFGSDATYDVKVVDANGEEVVFAIEDDNAIETSVTSISATNKPLVTYTLNDDGEVDSMVAANSSAGSQLSNAEMKTNGILGGKEVADDVVAFFYDSDDEEWSVYGYKDLEAAEAVSTDYVILDDATLVAMKLTSDISEADNEVIALVTDAYQYNVSSTKSYYELTALVDGKEVTYTTAAATTDAWNGKAVDKLYVLSFNADNEVSKVVAVTPDYTNDIADSIADNHVNVYRAGAGDGTNPAYAVYGKSGSSLDIASSVDTYNYLSVGYLYVFDGSDWSVEKLNTLSFGTKGGATGDSVMFIQTSEDSSTWNIAVKGGSLF